MKRQDINPKHGLTKILNSFNVNQAVEIRESNRVLYVSGQTSNDSEGKPKHEGDIVKQCELAWDNLVHVLAAAEMKPRNIVRLNFYTTDVDMFMANADELVSIWSSAGCMPTSTLLGVHRLFQPETMIELEAIAVD